MTRSLSNKLRGLTATALAASALFAMQPAVADIIEINNFWAGSGAATINFTGTNWHDGSTVTGLHEYGGSGGFKTYNLTLDPNRQNAFQSFCVDIFSSFSFAVSSNDTLKPATIISAQAAADLGELYTNHHAQIDSTGSSAVNESAFQLAVWEIVNERSGSYNLVAGTTGGNFTATGTGASLAQTWLNELSATSISAYAANIWTVDSMLGRPHFSGEHAQDVVVFTPIQTPVPEPETYAMMLVGLGLLGFSARRKSQF